MKNDDQRMRQYKTLAVAFSYPDEAFFACFPDLQNDKERLMGEYDRVFRAGQVWLYGVEYLVKNEFQRANELSDIMGFYTAFGLEPDKERPDSIACEMEFMYTLILKRTRAGQFPADGHSVQKMDVCLDAEKKFFLQHLEPAAAIISAKIIAQTENGFYVNVAKGMLEFLASERNHFGLTAAAATNNTKNEEIVNEQ